ncbi:hypothetical protein E3N88_23700 [Mikania micrantha]|uniref:Uncharacterized protein n=1 Tax=Mikania micrantha TaxID=192012 RepID=A0A5N6NF37_9ASTR|nr:hypothetical protein E3N88_23700 [Mikania micrantha]
MATSSDSSSIATLSMIINNFAQKVVVNSNKVNMRKWVPSKLEDVSDEMVAKCLSRSFSVDDNCGWLEVNVVFSTETLRHQSNCKVVFHGVAVCSGAPRDRPTMGLQEVGAYLKLDKTEAMLQPLTMHGEDFPPLSNLYDDGVYRNIHYNRPTMVHELGAYQTPDKRSNWFRPWLCQEDYFLHVSTSRNAVVLEHLGQHIMTFGQEKESHYVIAVADE